MSKTADADFEIRQQIRRIRKLQASLDAYVNEDINGTDSLTVAFTIADFNESLADAGMALADLLEELMGPDEFCHSDELYGGAGKG